MQGTTGHPTWAFTFLVLQIADLGEAWKLAESSESVLGVVGTTFFSAPEVFPKVIEGREMEPSAASKASDVWSLGATLYSVVCGQTKPIFALPIETEFSGYPSGQERLLVEQSWRMAGERAHWRSREWPLSRAEAGCPVALKLRGLVALIIRPSPPDRPTASRLGRALRRRHAELQPHFPAIDAAHHRLQERLSQLPHNSPVPNPTRTLSPRPLNTTFTKPQSPAPSPAHPVSTPADIGFNRRLAFSEINLFGCIRELLGG